MTALKSPSNVTARIADLRERFKSETIDTMEAFSILAPDYLIGRDSKSNVVNFCDWQQWNQWSQQQ